MKKFIATADDFGPHPYINQGIKNAVFSKNVNTVSCMVTFDQSENNIRDFMKECKEKNIEPGFGLHVSLTAGSPVLKDKAQTLTTDGKKFMPINFYDYDKTNPGEVFNEVEAQIVKLKKIGDEEGFRLDHLTCHHGIMGLFPDYLKTYFQLAIKYKVPIRNPILISRLRRWGFLSSGMKREGLYRGIQILKNEGSNQVAINLLTMSVKNLQEQMDKFTGGEIKHPAYFIDTFYKKANERRLRKILKFLPQNTNELVVHLGYGYFEDNDVERAKYNGINFDYFKTRKQELDSIQHVNINKYVTSRKDYEWIGFRGC